MTTGSPPLINNKGELNVNAWSNWYLMKHNVSYKQAHAMFNELARGMPEPSLTDKKGNPNKAWQTWYRLQKNVSSNVALKTCKMFIRTEQEGKPRPKVHETNWDKMLVN